MCSDFLERVTPGKVNYALWQEHINRYCFALKFVSQKVVLDIACGTGYGTNMLSKSAAIAIGVDISRDALKHALSHYCNNQNSGFVLADALHLPFRENAFELVVSFETIEHISNFERFLIELKYVLNNNGEIIISTPNDKVNYAFNRRRPINPYHVREFNNKDFSEELNLFSNEMQIYGQCPYTPKDQLFRFLETNLPAFIEKYRSIREPEPSCNSQANTTLVVNTPTINTRYRVQKNLTSGLFIFPRFIVAVVKNEKGCFCDNVYDHTEKCPKAPTDKV